MKQQLHFVTIATADLDAARRFYAEALGWTPALDVPGEIIFFQVAPGLMLGFFDTAKFNQDLGGLDRSAVSGLTLAHNVENPEDVRALTDAMCAAGGSVLQAPQAGEFGGVFHAHVEDPNGVVWEIGHNPGWSVAEDGTVRL